MSTLPSQLPKWAFDVVMSLVRFEDEHGDAHPCLKGALDLIPQGMQNAARAILDYHRVSNYVPPVPSLLTTPENSPKAAAGAIAGWTPPLPTPPTGEGAADNTVRLDLPAGYSYPTPPQPGANWPHVSPLSAIQSTALGAVDLVAPADPPATADVPAALAPAPDPEPAYAPQ